MPTAADDDDVRASLRALQETTAQLARSLDDVAGALTRIEARLEATQASCANMDEHIEFVESVYTAVRQPLSYLVHCWRAEPLPRLRMRTPLERSGAGCVLHAKFCGV